VVVGAAAGIGADQYPAPRPAGQLRQRQRGGLDVLAGGVRSGAPRPQQERQRLAGALGAMISEWDMRRS